MGRRIKAEGDAAALEAPIGKVGVHVDTSRRDQVVARFKALDLPTHRAGV